MKTSPRIVVEAETPKLIQVRKTIPLKNNIMRSPLITPAKVPKVEEKKMISVKKL